jgi:hypothetical protein
MWCWRRTKEISWTDRVRNEEVLHTVKEERNIIHTVKRRETNRTDHILCWNCFLNRSIEGQMEGGIYVTARQRRKSKQLLDDLKETTGYCKFKQEALGRTVWRTRFGRGCGPVVRQTTT